MRCPMGIVGLALLASICLGRGMWWIGGVAVVLFLVLASYQRWVGIGALLAGMVVGGWHYQDYQRLALGMEQLSRMRHAGAEIRCGRAEVLSSKKRPHGVESIVRLVEEGELIGYGESVAAGSRLQILGREDYLTGDLISVEARLMSGVGIENFGQVDWQAVRARTGVVGRFYVTSETLVERARWRQVGYQWIAGVRTHALKTLRRGLVQDDPAYWIVPALLLGVEPEGGQVMELFRTAGVMHLFVVSGLHVGLVFGMVWGVMYLTPVPTRVVLLVGVIVVWGYALLTGLEPPVMRAGLVLTLFVSSLLWRRRVSAYNSLLTALCFVLLWEPYGVFDIGVWLSFVIVGVLILSVDRGVRWVVSWSLPDPYLPEALWSVSQRLRIMAVKWVGGVLVLSLVAWLASTVIMACAFGQVYLCGVVSSLLLVPLAFVMMVIGSVVLCIGGVFSMLPIGGCNEVNDAVARVTVSIVEAVGQLDQAVVCLSDYGYQDGVTVFDLPDGEGALYYGDWLLDAGSAESLEGVILPCLERAGITPERVVLTHADRGHRGDPDLIPEVVEAYHEGPSQWRRGAGVIESYPVAVEGSRRSDDHVACLKVTENGVRVLYCADAGLQVLEQLQSMEVDLGCEVLVMGQHLYGETIVEDWLHATGARQVILGRTYAYLAPRQYDGEVEVYDQRYTGAVRVCFGEEWGEYRIESINRAEYEEGDD